MIDLSKKWVLVTGAARGIGRQVALVMAERGANLILHSRDLEHTKALEAEVKAKGVETFSIAAELNNHESRQKFLAELDSKNLQIDVVCNNAGLQTPYRVAFWEVHEADYLTSFQVNAIAPIQISCHFLPKMLKAGFGRVICTTSGIAKEPEQMAYAAGKAALDKFVRDTAHKLSGKDVTLNLLDPGWLRTDLGGPNAPNSVETVVPGAIVAAFASSKVNGKWISAQDYKDLSLEAAVEKLEDR
ncbi:MAG: SDR family oxidoreductase [Fibromonadaceae bacterium]|jgi:short-subunit dehydrogenase|nr:SDR family oxidoreductase [Fibromonadaceae bacterium]